MIEHVRRVTIDQVVADIVGVQPMVPPHNFTFTLKARYS